MSTTHTSFYLLIYIHLLFSFSFSFSFSFFYLSTFNFCFFSNHCILLLKTFSTLIVKRARSIVDVVETIETTSWILNFNKFRFIVVASTTKSLHWLLHTLLILSHDQSISLVALRTLTFWEFWHRWNTFNCWEVFNHHSITLDKSLRKCFWHNLTFYCEVNFDRK